MLLCPAVGNQGLEKWPWPPNLSMTGRVVSHFATFHQGCQGMCYKTPWTEMKLWSVCLPGVHKPLGFVRPWHWWRARSLTVDFRILGGMIPPSPFQDLGICLWPFWLLLTEKGCSCEKHCESVFRLWGSRQPSSCWLMMSYALKTWTESGSDRPGLWLIVLELKEKGNQS